MMPSVAVERHAVTSGHRGLMYLLCFPLAELPVSLKRDLDSKGDVFV